MSSEVAAGWTLVERSERIMGTQVGVHVAAPVEGVRAAQRAIDACLTWMVEVEDRLTRFRPESELSLLNAEPGVWHPVSDLLFAAVEQSRRAAERTGGLYDPALLPALEALGYDRDFAAVRQAESAGNVEAAAAVPVPAGGAWRGIELDRVRRRIRLAAGTRLDLGGIAKGWAADVALARFFDDCPNAIVDVGGDLRLRGERQTGEPWGVGIGDPRVEQALQSTRHLAVLAFRRGGLATSSATGRWWTRGGERRHHLLDPRTGRPMRLWIDESDNSGDDREDAGPLIASATALAPTAAHAEVAAKVALLRGYPAALRAVETAWTRTPEIFGDAGVALILVLGNGNVACSANLQEYLDTLGGGGNIWLT
jgi:thiamine biosynthesis lipoprotein